MRAVTCHLAVRIIGIALTVVGASAAPIGCASDTDACKALIAKSETLQARSGATVLAVGGQRVAVGNTEAGGIVCAFMAVGGKVAVSDTATGADEVGRMSGVRLMEVQNKAFLATVQTFRGGSNSARESHVVYLIEAGKIRTVLELPSLEELAIGDYRLSERKCVDAESRRFACLAGGVGASRFRTWRGGALPDDAAARTHLRS